MKNKITDTETSNRRAMCAEVQPLTAVIKHLAAQDRQPVSIAFHLVRRGLCVDIAEASREVRQHYPWV